jgi:hypothetical protein
VDRYSERRAEGRRPQGAELAVTAMEHEA